MSVEDERPEPGDAPDAAEAADAATPEREAAEAGDDAPGGEAGAGTERPGPGELIEPAQQVRLVEALLFAAAEPLAEADIAARLPETADVPALLEYLESVYANRGVRLVRVGERWAFRTAPDLAPYLQLERRVAKKLSRAATETLAIIAYHQPVTRAEIETIRGVATSKGTLDTLLEAGWVRPGPRRQTPGRPVTWRTTETFLDHFGLSALTDLPGLEELSKAGLIDARPAVLAMGGSEEGSEQASDETDENDDGETPPDPAG